MTLYTPSFVRFATVWASNRAGQARVERGFEVAPTGP